MTPLFDTAKEMLRYCWSGKNSSSFPALLKTFPVKTPPVFLLDPSIMFTFVVWGVGLGGGGGGLLMVVANGVGGGGVYIPNERREGEREKEMQCSFRWNPQPVQMTQAFVHGVHSLAGE